MGQRGRPTDATAVASMPCETYSETYSLAVFPTDLGWFGLLGHGETVVGLAIGHASADEARRASRRQPDVFRTSVVESDWHPELRRRLERYARGEPVEFEDCDVQLPPRTEFQSRVVAATRALRYGARISYGDLAAEVGAPRAARAVGTVMATNPIPLLIPCHRVVGASGRLGGYSAPQGLLLKQRLLAMEAAHGLHGH